VFGKRIREIFTRPGKPSGPHSRPAPLPRLPQLPANHVKRSLGLSHFVDSIRDSSGLSILDLGELSQPNVSFITSLGHRLHSVDFIRLLDSFTAPGDPPGGPAHRNRMEAFLDQTLGFAPGSLDGALVWDSLQYLSRPLLLATIDRLHQILRPGAPLLALFHATEHPVIVPVYSFRIENAETLHLSRRAERELVEVFNNRSIERLFDQFDSIKFFLTRDHLREVILRR